MPTKRPVKSKRMLEKGLVTVALLETLERCALRLTHDMERTLGVPPQRTCWKCVPNCLKCCVEAAVRNLRGGKHG